MPGKAWLDALEPRDFYWSSYRPKMQNVRLQTPVQIAWEVEVISSR